MNHNQSPFRRLALSAVIAIGVSLVPARAEGPAKQLAFNADGRLKILQITDIHWKDGGGNDMKSLALISRLVEKEKPDVIVFTGDLVYGKKCPRPKEALDRIIAVAIQRNIPWTFTPGNHDGHGVLGKKAFVAYLRGKPLCLMNGAAICPDGVSHMVPVYDRRSGRAEAALFLFDSTGDGTRSNAYIIADITREQVGWYEKESGISAVAFMHKPTAEFFDTDRYPAAGGSLRLVLPYNKTESPLVKAFMRSGTMRAVFCGHLHSNSLMLNAGGVTLGFTVAAGYNAIGLPWVARGGRVVLLTGNGRSFKTWETAE